MPDLEIYSRDGGRRVRDLLSSFVMTLLLSDRTTQPIYLLSPWISDFILIDNSFGEIRGAFTSGHDLGEKNEILFSDTLVELSSKNKVRIATWTNKYSQRFAEKLKTHPNIEVRFDPQETDHQKGFLTELFYFQGSMNFTYSGVYKNKEKVICYSSSDAETHSRIQEAYLEFERIWENYSQGRI